MDDENQWGMKIVELDGLLTFLVALFSALFVMPNLSHVANRIGLVDHPNERKMHRIPRPLVGGIGIVISATFSGLVFVPLAGLRGFFAGMAILLLVGFFDDFLEVNHNKKFLAQIVATTALMYLSHVSLNNFGDLVGIGEIRVPGYGIVLWGVTVFCVVGVTNAVNMIDGLDGLAGGVTFIAFICFAILASYNDSVEFSNGRSLTLLNLALAGGVLGFLRYNWFPSRIFMGDAGALCLGFALSFMAVALTQMEGAVVRPAAVLLVLAVPIADTLVVMIRRVISGKSPFKPDKTHLHHILVENGFSGKQAVQLLLLVSSVFSGLAIWGTHSKWPDPLLFSIFLGFWLLDCFAARILDVLGAAGRLFQRREKPKNCPAMVHSLFRQLLGRRFFRASPRYTVDIAITCCAYDTETVRSGRMRNLSLTGFLAEIDDLGFLCKECVVTLHSPLVEDQLSVEFQAEHLWSNEAGGCSLHGFRFVDLTLEQEKLLRRYITKLETDAEQSIH